MKFLKQMLAAIVGCFIALGLLIIITFSILGSIIPSEPRIHVSPSSVLEIDLSQPIVERPVESPFDITTFMPDFIPISLHPIGVLDMVKAIDAAAEDPNIKLIFLKKCENTKNISYLEEMRNALKKFRTSGKPVIAYVENITTPGYYAASIADKIYLDEVSVNLMHGISSQVIFFKDILDKLGVEVQLIRHGKYKSAGEQFTNNDISPANREQNQAMIDAMWRSIRDDICESKGIEPAVLDDMIENLKLNKPQDIIDAGLADKIVSPSEMSEILCTLTGAKEVKNVHYVTLSKYAKAMVKNNYKVKDKIAIIYADGSINQTGNDGITSNKFLPLLRQIKEDSSIKAVVFRVNSPGGAVQPAEQIRKELEIIGETRPLVVSYGTVAASGGYWISAGADKIFSNNTTITGSIGVFSLIPSFENSIKKLHINPVIIKTHSHADMMQLMRKFDQKEIDAQQSYVELIYSKFLSVVSKGRGIPVEEVDKIAQGRVWCGNEALGINLVDEIGGIKEALDYAAISANLDQYRIVSYPAMKNPIKKAIKSLNSKATALENISDPESVIENIYDKIKAEGGVYARLPFLYNFE